MGTNKPFNMRATKEILHYVRTKYASKLPGIPTNKNVSCVFDYEKDGMYRGLYSFEMKHAHSRRFLRIYFEYVVNQRTRKSSLTAYTKNSSSIKNWSSF